VTTDHPIGRRSRRGRGWLVSLLGLALVAVPGFALGLFAGVLWEDPGLILGDAVGESEEVPWGEPSQAQTEGAAQAAAAPAAETAAAADQATAPAESAPAAGPDVAAAPPPAPPPLPSADRAAVPARRAGKLSVQVGAFADSRSAEQLAERLRKAGLQVYVSPSAAAEGDKRWRVRVGPYKTREEADQIATRLKTKEKLPTWVLTEDGA
jgi:cell division septation protein DedD